MRRKDKLLKGGGADIYFSIFYGITSILTFKAFVRIIGYLSYYDIKTIMRWILHSDKNVSLVVRLILVNVIAIYLSYKLAYGDTSVIQYLKEIIIIVKEANFNLNENIAIHVRDAILKIIEKLGTTFYNISNVFLLSIFSLTFNYGVDEIISDVNDDFNKNIIENNGYIKLSYFTWKELFYSLRKKYPQDLIYNVPIYKELQITIETANALLKTILKTSKNLKQTEITIATLDQKNKNIFYKITKKKEAEPYKIFQCHAKKYENFFGSKCDKLLTENYQYEYILNYVQTQILNNTKPKDVYVYLYNNSDMEIRVITIDNKTILMNVNYFDTIKDIKQKIHDTVNIPIDKQCLTFAGKRIDDDNRILGSYVGYFKQSKYTPTFYLVKCYHQPIWKPTVLFT
jgi:hypothetical protein